MRRFAFLAAVLLLVVALAVSGCSSGTSASDGYEEPQSASADLAEQVEALQSELAAVTAERDQLLAEREADDARYETVRAFTELRNRVASDPAAFGTEEEVLDLLSDGASPGAEMDDEAFGSVSLRTAWRNTLFGGNVDAVTTEWRSWVCSDGRLGGSLWTWEGTNQAGEPFSLIGINLNSYDDEGRLTVSKVIWPYPHEYVFDEFLR